MQRGVTLLNLKTIYFLIQGKPKKKIFAIDLKVFKNKVQILPAPLKTGIY